MKKLIVGLTLFITMSLPFSAGAGLAQLTDLFVFGDSLSDGGNSGLRSQQYTGIPAVVFPPSPYYNGQYSNGPVAVEHLWNLYNPGDIGGLKPSLAGSTNYAIGGATTGAESYNSVNPSVPDWLKPAYAQLGAAWQLGAFTTNTPAFDPATSLFVVWLFANDIFYETRTGMLPGVVPGSPGGANLVSNAIANILTTIGTLANAGAQHFLIPNMVDLGLTPEFRGTAAAPGLSALTAVFNTNLAAQLDSLDDILSAEIVQFDAAAALADLVANPNAYGFTNATEKCIDNLLNGRCDEDTWVFWDGVHPTTNTHALLAGEIRAALPEPGTLYLLAVVLFWGGAARARVQTIGR